MEPNVQENDEALPTDTDEWLQDMELMQYYSTRLAKERVLWKDESSILWEEVIPQEALKHGPLLHALLALAALHLAYTRPDRAPRYLRMCDKHQTAAITKFREILDGDLTEENSAAAFALAMTISVSSMARSHATVAYQPEPRALTMDDIVEGIVLAQGVRSITSNAHKYLVTHPLSQMFYGYTTPETKRPTIHLPDSIKKHFAEVQNMLEQQCEPNSLAHCLEAWRELVEIYHHLKYFLSRGPVESGVVWRWPATLSEEFTKLIQARHPPTLVILAHYAAATAPLHGSWFVRDWGQFAIRGVGMVLQDDMVHWLEWPQRQVDCGLEMLRGQDLYLEKNAHTIDLN
ncbi:hypothetical protein LTR62_003617 [Meristemomyces frigidus]|uniref:Uncharacterized protein n=1 Tax=Meristemomyces frigidus TaxID=1508187 RepID=A0AAN7TEW1_9PEZI|nr:hypothetical protein LTR62_003617 [Meristemomyces frigidus]